MYMYEKEYMYSYRDESINLIDSETLRVVKVTIIVRSLAAVVVCVI